MPEYLNQKEAFLKCKKEGRFIVTEETDIEKIKATVKIAEGDIESANSIKKNLSKHSNQWNSVYKLYYDALHELSESYLRFEKIKIDKHQCSNKKEIKLMFLVPILLFHFMQRYIFFLNSKKNGK